MIVKVPNEVQPKKEEPTCVTFSGSLIVFKDVQRSKSLSLSVVKLAFSGSLTLRSDEQWSKAESPMVVTLSGIEMEASDTQYEKACSLMVVRVSGRVTLSRLAL